MPDTPTININTSRNWLWPLVALFLFCSCHLMQPKESPELKYWRHQWDSLGKVFDFWVDSTKYYDGYSKIRLIDSANAAYKRYMAASDKYKYYIWEPVTHQ